MLNVKPVKKGTTTRMSFGKIEEVMEMPNLIEVQKNSYKWFLDTGLKEVFRDIAEITDYTGNWVLTFIDYRIDEKTKHTVQEGEGRRVTRRVYFDFRFIRHIDDAIRQRLRDRGYVAKGLLEENDMGNDTVNLTLFRTYAERYLARHADVNADMIYMVRQHEATPTGLPVEFYFFLHEKQWKSYEEKMAAILEHFYASIPDFGLSIYQRDVAEQIQHFLH